MIFTVLKNSLIYDIFFWGLEKNPTGSRPAFRLVDFVWMVHDAWKVFFCGTWGPHVLCQKPAILPAVYVSGALHHCSESRSHHRMFSLWTFEKSKKLLVGCLLGYSEAKASSFGATKYRSMCFLKRRKLQKLCNGEKLGNQNQQFH